MNGSYVHMLHLIGFALVVTAIVTSFVLDRKLRAEPDWGKKLQIGMIMRTFGMFTPWVVALLLLTGIGNMINRYTGAPYPWYDETWIVIKLCLFVIIAFNALFLVKKVGMKRAMVIKSIADKSGGASAEKEYQRLNRSVSILMAVQSALLLAILYLAVFGPGRHPGMF